MEIDEKFNFGGWENCIRITYGEAELVATTDVGPRIVRLGFIGGQNIFKEFKQQQGKTGGKEWLIYGGHRFWHSPEAMPRTYYPDNNPVEYNWNGKTLKLTQRTEETTGVQKEMEITIESDDGSVKVLHRLINHNLWDIEAAPWAISAMTQGGRAVIPQEPYQSGEENLLPVRPVVLWGYIRMKDPRWVWGDKFIQLKQDPESETAQKFGVLNTPGWMAYYLNGMVFIKRYDCNRKLKYPDFGVNTEVYTNQDILEMETLGNLVMIPPGGSTEHVERWFLLKASLDEDENSLESKLMPLVERTGKKF